MSEILEKSVNVLESVFKHTAPYDKGNLRYAMLSTPIVFGQVAIVEFGTEWENRSKTKYNYGQLLNDKRVIKNRESEDREKRLRNRVIKSADNTRNIIVKDLRYGKNLRMSRQQLYSNNKRLNKENKPRQYELLFIDKNIPIKKSTTPYRVNRHYHYLDDFYDIYIRHLANAFGGVLHKGDYEVKKGD